MPTNDAAMTTADIRATCKTRSDLAILATPRTCEWCSGSARRGGMKCSWCVNGKAPLSQMELVKIAKEAKRLGCVAPQIDEVVAAKARYATYDNAERGEPKGGYGWSTAMFYDNALKLVNGILA